MAFPFFRSGTQQSSSSSSSSTSFADDFLRATNEYRTKHQAPPLQLNAQISRTAQSWAENLARTNSFKHSSSAKYNGEDMGENIATKWSSNREQFTGKEVAEMWYNEVQNYNFNTNSGAKTGHFTQLVWKGSKQVGIGKATGPNGECLIVANFYPAGNYIGKYGENVLPPRDGKITISVTPTNPSSARNDTTETTWSRATPAAPSGGTRLDVRSNSPRIQVRQTIADDQTSFPSTGRLSQNFFSNESRSATATQRQVRQETSGSGPNAVTKTVVIETVRGPDGSVRTVQTEKVSSGDQRFSENTFSDFPKTQNQFRALTFESRSTDDRNVKPTAFVDTKGTVPSSDKKSWFSATSRNRGAETGASGGAARETTTTPGKYSASSSSNSSGGQTMKEFQEDIVRCHNRYRRQHGRVGDLTMNRELNDLSQRWAETLSASSTLRHSDVKFKGQNVGENLACKYGSGSVDYSGAEVVDQWYREIDNYSFRSPETSNFQKTGHFTQVVWKGSKEIGIGRAASRDGRQIFVVCNYLPAGNFVGRYKENVLPSD